MPQLPDRVLTFMVGGERCSTDIAHVAEIIDPLPVQPIPRATPAFRGMMQHHGALVPVLDLQAHLGRGNTPDPGQLLIVTATLANLALLVPVVGRIEAPAALAHQANPTPLFPLAAQIAAGTVPVLDLSLLVEELAAELGRS